MKRAILLATVALLAMLVLAPVAMAQSSTMMSGGSSMMGGGSSMMGGGSSMMSGGSSMMGGGQMKGSSMMQSTTSGGQSGKPLPGSGGPAILLPAAALLVGSGILTYAILRRR